MFSQYYGNYLLNKGYITQDQLIEALEIQKSVHVKLGILAVNAGYMTASQVDFVHEKQKRADKKFGELAVELGYISEEELSRLLSSQKQNHLFLGQALTDKNYLTLEQLQASLEDYKKDYGLSERQFNMVRQDDIDEMVKVFFHFGEALWSKVYVDYASLMLKNIIRFIDNNPMAEINRISGEYEADWFVYQEIKGRINMLTGIACNNRTFIELAGRFAGMKITQADELARDSVGEFLNLHNGIFLVNMSNNGLALEMKPQLVSRENKLKGLKKGYIISCYLTWGKIDIIIL